MFKPLSFLTLSILATSANATQKDIVPICLNENDSTVTYLNAEKKSVPISLIPIVLIDGNVRYGFDAANVTQEEFLNWKNQCNENATLMAYDVEIKKYMPFKTEVNTSSNQFINRFFDYKRTVNTELEKENELNVYAKGFIFLTALAEKKEEFPEVAEYLAKTNDLMLYFQGNGIPNHTYTESDTLVINYMLFPELYETNDGYSLDRYTYYRAITHQLLHKALPPDTAERDIIDMSNKILTAMNLRDKPRALYDTTDYAPTYRDPILDGPEQHIEADPNTGRTKRAVARREPTPNERFHDYIFRHPLDFVSDPSVYFLAFGIATQLGSTIGPTIALRYGAVRPITPTPSPSATRLLTDTSALVASSSASVDVAIAAAEVAIETAEMGVEAAEVASTFEHPNVEESVAIESAREVIITDPVEHLVQPTEPREITSAARGRSRIRVPDTSSRADSTSISSRGRQSLFSRTSQLGPELYELSDLSSIGSAEEGMSDVLSETQDTSLSTIHEPSSASEEVGLDMLTERETERFLAKMNRDLDALDLPNHRKMTIRHQLRPNAHYVSQAPLLIREYLAGNKTLEALVEGLPKY